MPILENPMENEIDDGSWVCAAEIIVGTAGAQ